MGIAMKENNMEVPQLKKERFLKIIIICIWRWREHGTEK